MSTIGEDLRKQRELKHSTLEEAARSTKIGARYLKALEEDRYDILPGAIYSKAYIRIYASYLGLDPEDMTRRYGGLAFKEAEETPVLPLSPPADSGPMNPLFVVAGVGLSVLAAIFFFVARREQSPWARMFDRSIAQASSEAEPLKVAEPPIRPAPSRTAPPAEASPAPAVSPSISEPAVAPSVTPAEGSPGALSPNAKPDVASAFGSGELPSATVPAALRKEEPTTPATPASAATPPVMNLEVTANEKCWVEAYADHARAVGRTIETGQKVDLRAYDKFLLTLGSAGAVDLRLNGHSMKRVGKLGEVKKVLITSDNYRELLE